MVTCNRRCTIYIYVINVGKSKRTWVYECRKIPKFWENNIFIFDKWFVIGNGMGHSKAEDKWK